MQAFFDKSQENVTGIVRAKLYKGGVWPLARTSPTSLFSEDLATFEGGNYDHKDAAGFIRLYGLRLGLFAAVRDRAAASAPGPPRPWRPIRIRSTMTAPSGSRISAPPRPMPGCWGARAS